MAAARSHGFVLLSSMFEFEFGCSVEEEEEEVFEL